MRIRAFLLLQNVETIPGQSPAREHEKVSTDQANTCGGSFIHSDCWHTFSHVAMQSLVRGRLRERVANMTAGKAERIILQSLIGACH
jgi:hypothetical protein